MHIRYFELIQVISFLYFSSFLYECSEKAGDVAFIKDTTYDSSCGDDAETREAWCVDKTKLRKLVDFGPVPSHMIVAKKTSVTPKRRAVDAVMLKKLQEGFLKGIK